MSTAAPDHISSHQPVMHENDSASLFYQSQGQPPRQAHAPQVAGHFDGGPQLWHQRDSNTAPHQHGGHGYSILGTPNPDMFHQHELLQTHIHANPGGPLPRTSIWPLDQQCTYRHPALSHSHAIYGFIPQSSSTQGLNGDSASVSVLHYPGDATPVRGNVPLYSLTGSFNDHLHDASPIEGQPPDLPPPKVRKAFRGIRLETISCAEKGCKRNFRPTSPTSKLCRRHQQKYDRNHAGPPVFTFPAGISDYLAAKTKIYPHQAPLCVDGEQLSQAACDAHADNAVQRFVAAASTPYEAGSVYHEFHTRQQKVFNGRGFKDDEVNIRMRFLYQAIVVLHTGGETVYPEGGDNGGYGRPDKTLNFLDRVDKIVEILKLDKRVCMDVVEGRGVTAFVANPDKFEKRKTQNKDSNERKQQKQKLGDRVQAKRKAKGKATEESDADSDDWSGDEDDQEDGEQDEVGNGPSVASNWRTPQSMAMDYDGSSAARSSPLFDGPASRTRKRTLPGSSAAASGRRGAKKPKHDTLPQQDPGPPYTKPVLAPVAFPMDDGYHSSRLSDVALHQRLYIEEATNGIKESDLDDLDIDYMKEIFSDTP